MWINPFSFRTWLSPPLVLHMLLVLKLTLPTDLTVPIPSFWISLFPIYLTYPCWYQSPYSISKPEYGQVIPHQTFE